MKKPISFNIFIIAIIVFLASVLPALYTADMLLAMLLTVIVFVAMILALIGFIVGLNFKSNEVKAMSLNKIGVVGNCALFILIVTLLFLALF